MNTKPQEPLEQWEQALHRELMQLPELEAPPTLIDRVRHQLQAPAPAAWHHSSWWQWSFALRAVSVLLVPLLLGALGWLSGTFGELGLGLRVIEFCAGLKNTWSFTLNTCETVLGTSSVFMKGQGQMILLAVAALLTATYLTCLAAGTALYQLAWRRSS